MNKRALCRFSVSMPEELVQQFDEMAEEKGFSNRSQALSSVVRDALVEYHGQCGTPEIAGTITLVYDHHTRNIQMTLTEVQHDHGDLIIAAMHVHLDHQNCMEVLAVRGEAQAVKSMADHLITTKGIKHGRLTMTTTGQEFTS